MVKTTFSALSLAVLFGFFYGCSPSATQQLYQAPPPSVSSFQDTLPFDLREGFIVVRARLNGKSMPLDFIWDSGAPVSTISKATCQYLGLPAPAGSGVTTRLDSLQLGQLTFPSVPAKVVSYDGYAAPKCIAEAGVIGANIIRHCNWYIDFDRQIIVFSDLARESPAVKAAHMLGFKTTPFGQPEMRLATEAMGKNKVIASIGHSGSARINGKKLPDDGTMIYDRGVVDRFASDVDTAVVFENTSMQLETLSWEGPLKVQVKRRSQVGNALWAQYNVALDFKTNTIQLSERAESGTIDLSLPRLGWMPHFTPTSELTVGFIAVGSPAWEAGLRMGDVIDQIDRRAAPGWYNDYCAYLSRVRAQFAAPEKMQVFKNGSKQPISLSVQPVQ